MMLQKLIARLRGRPLNSPHAEAASELPEPLSFAQAGNWEHNRLVVVDLETSGLNLNKDIVLAIGAVAVNHGRIDLADQFESVLAQPAGRPGESLLIHGLGPDALEQGQPPEEALLSFLRWAGDAVFVAFHAPFDQRMLQRALQDHLSLDRKPHWLDLADVMPALFPDAKVEGGQLDPWVAHFGLNVAERHNASADALVTAELMLIAMHAARRQGIIDLAGLERKARLTRQLRAQRHRF
ncbi:MAG: DNA polymerase III subunit epsilon [Alteromonadaceae bacterium]|nr:DNA polymerase III subunit epsilon [Alteromonadaceae bacterium]